MKRILVLLFLVASHTVAQAKPNILVIMGDDIGIPNISAYSHGMMGYKTPNIDRVAKEGLMFTDYYGEQSCTAGRAAFITGQHVIRTGLSKVGLPGAPVGIQDEDPTLAELLKPQGYVSGQFGKNHFGDQDRFLPTAHGFDEFFGNLYHLDSEEEPEDEFWPDNDANGRVPRPRGVLKASVDGPVEDTGPLTKARMETVDQEFQAAAMDFIDRQHRAGKPWFTWMNTSRMHFWTHVGQANRGKSGLNEYADGMLEFDAIVGDFLKKLEDLGILENTIVIVTTDNGVHQNTWPDAGATWFHGEKTTNWEGGFRVPAMVRFPKDMGIPRGEVINHVTSHLDWVPTLMAAAGEPDIAKKLKSGYRANGKRFKIHLDGHNMLPLWRGEIDKNPREYYIYATDGGEISAIRWADRWKAMYMVQDATGLHVWMRKLTKLKAPLLFDLRMDPFEKMYDTNGWGDFWARHPYFMAWAGSYVREFKETFKEFPQRQKPATWNVTELE